MEITLAFVAVFAVVFFGLLLLVAKTFVRAGEGEALIVHKVQGPPLVTFSGAVALPILHRAERMDVSVRTIQWERKGTEGVLCRDNIRADLGMTFFVRVNPTTQDVLAVAHAIGAERASRPETIRELFAAKFGEAVKTVAKQLDFAQFFTDREAFKDRIIEVIGCDLNGFVLDDVAVHHIEQTPVGLLDPRNILDSQGIEKIAKATASGANHVRQLASGARDDDRPGLARFRSSLVASPPAFAEEATRSLLAHLSVALRSPGLGPSAGGADVARLLLMLDGFEAADGRLVEDTSAADHLAGRLASADGAAWIASIADLGADVAGPIFAAAGELPRDLAAAAARRVIEWGTTPQTLVDLFDAEPTLAARAVCAPTDAESYRPILDRAVDEGADPGARIAALDVLAQLAPDDLLAGLMEVAEALGADGPRERLAARSPEGRLAMAGGGQLSKVRS